MRPRKRVAIYCPQSGIASQYAFILFHRISVAPMPCTTLSEVAAVNRRDALLILVTDVTDLALVTKLARDENGPVVMRDLRTRSSPMPLAADFLVGRSGNMATLIDTLRTAFVGKRGPKAAVHPKVRERA